MAANISDFNDEIELYVKNATVDTTLLDGQIVRTLRDFCKQTWMWRYTLAAMNVTDTQPNYTLTMIETEGANELVCVDWVKWKPDGEDDDQYVYVNPVTLENEETPQTGAWTAAQTEVEGDQPTDFWVENDSKLWLNPIPNENAAGTGNMLVKVIVMPSLDATKCPQFFYDNWLETIAYGTAGRILKMAAKKWYDPELSEYYEGKYNKSRDDEAKKQRWSGKNRTIGKMIFPNMGKSSQNKWG